MRILYFTRDYSPHDYRFITALVGAGQQVISLRLERRGALLEERPLPPQVEQIDWCGGQAEFRWRDALTLRADLHRVIEQVKPDVVHAGPVPTAAYLAAAAGAKPLVSMCWGSDLLRDIDSSRWLRWTARSALRRSRVLIGDCQAVRQKAETLGFPGERVVLFPWGVDLQQFTPQPMGELRRTLGWKDNFVLLSMRSWEPVYGVDLLVHAFANAVRQEPRLRLLLVGNGSLAGSIHQTLAKHNAADKVYFAGRVINDQLAEIYSSADLYVSASYSDGSSVSLMEALACGKPALVSDIPGNREWIKSDETGWFFQCGDKVALVDGILHAVNQADRLPEMGDRCRSLAETRANWSENFKQLLRAYEMAVGGDKA